MDKIIENFWSTFEQPEGYKLVNEEYLAHIYLGYNNEKQKTVLIEIPQVDYDITLLKLFSLENIELVYNKKLHSILISLKDNSFFEVFKQFIINILESIAYITSPHEYAPKITALYNKWGAFFEKQKIKEIRLKKLLGIIGEVYFIKYAIEQKLAEVENIISAWEGPNMKSHDFIFESKNIEIKTKLKTSENVSISSIHQLENDKPLFLGIVNINRIEDEKAINCITFSKFIEQLKDLLLDNGLDYSLFISKLLSLGINIFDTEQIELLDNFKFEILSLDFFDSSLDDFPKLTSDILPQGVTKVKYAIKVKNLEKFQINIL